MAMNILITNDDGIDDIGLRLLADFAKTLGNVTVIAPKVEQSGMSHAIDFTRPIEVKKVDFSDGITAYTMDSTPADCVRFSALGLGKSFDLVLSGINRGINVGDDIVYSGTVGAVFEAARLGMHSIAFSAFPDSQREAAEHLDHVYRYIVEHDLFAENPVFNVNIPKNPREIRMTYQGSPYYADTFVRKTDDLYVLEGHIIPDVCPNDERRDTVAVLRDYISVTPLLTTRTNMDMLKRHGIL